MFTYDPTLADDISVVRFYLDDTEADIADFQDEELQFLISDSDSPIEAAAEAAFRLYSSYSKRATVAEVDDVRVEYRDRANALKALYDSLKKKAKADAVKRAKKTPMFFGGLDKDRFDANREDTSLTPADFTKGSVRFNRRSPSLTDLDYEYRQWRFHGDSYWYTEE